MTYSFRGQLLDPLYPLWTELSFWSLHSDWVFFEKFSLVPCRYFSMEHKIYSHFFNWNLEWARALNFSNQRISSKISFSPIPSSLLIFSPYRPSKIIYMILYRYFLVKFALKHQKICSCIHLWSKALFILVFRILCKILVGYLSKFYLLDLLSGCFDLIIVSGKFMLRLFCSLDLI